MFFHPITIGLQCQDFNISVVDGRLQPRPPFPLTHSWRRLLPGFGLAGGPRWDRTQQRVKSAEIRIMRFLSQSDEAENRRRGGKFNQMIKAVSTVPMEECCGWKNEGTGCCRTHHRSSFSKPQPSLCRNQSSCQPISDKEGDAACRRTGIKSRRETCCGESAGNFPELRSCGDGGGGKMDGGIMRRRRRKRLRKLLASKFVFSPGEGVKL